MKPHLDDTVQCSRDLGVQTSLTLLAIPLAIAVSVTVVFALTAFVVTANDSK